MTENISSINSDTSIMICLGYFIKLKVELCLIKLIKGCVLDAPKFTNNNRYITRVMTPISSLVHFDGDHSIGIADVRIMIDQVLQLYQGFFTVFYHILEFLIFEVTCK